jgi:uncharacterized protein YecT (DUF1311 family)
MISKCCLLLILMTSPATLGAEKHCYDTAKTQEDLRKCADNEAEAADKRLNDDYQLILKEYSTDPAFIAKLNSAQQAWLNFRDAELQAVYPHENKLASYGRVWPMCTLQERTRLTEERTKELRRWVKGIPEGDLCAGPIKFEAAAKTSKESE